MQEESPHQPSRRPSNFNYLFTLSKSIRSWQDFASTFLPLPFDEALNIASKEQLEVFWKQYLEQLCGETEKICILVPAELVKNEANQVVGQVKAEDGQEKTNKKGLNKQKNKDKKPVSAPKVKLNKKISEVAMNLVTQNFPTLDFDYASLFLGNPKQLLIFRKCFAVDNYIQKYRLPSSFKEPLQRLMFLTEQFHHLRVERNRAISNFDAAQSQETTRKLSALNTEIDDKLITFSKQWREILKDFRAKNRCRELLLNSVSTELINLLRPLCQQCETEIIDRYAECESDQYKDILVVKKEDPRLIPADEHIYDERKEEVVKYVYLQPERKPEPPSDIRNLLFFGISLKKHCYQYRIELKNDEKWNRNEGIFIRSEQGEKNYELNINLPQKCSSIDVDIYPYDIGKNSYEIYVWNFAGLTKSTEKIVLFNELELNTQKRQTLKNKKVYLLGLSEYGVKYDGRSENVEEEMVMFPFRAKELSIKNGAIICDEAGDVATWGQMYFPQQNTENDQTEPSNESQQFHFRIETPSLVMNKKYIRKVSCGAGYCLMLSIFGSIYSMGTNEFGQLGLGSFNEGFQNTEPREICKFTNQNSSFITDIKATSTGASFALNHKGELYRWGFNQVNSTDFPIYDRFGSIINYSSVPITYKWCDPNKVGKKYIPESIKQIESGNGFHYALTNDGILYGWGICKFLGINELLDLNEKIVIDIVNPIVIMKDISYISACSDHSVAITTNCKVLAWGEPSCFSNKVQKFVTRPLDITPEIEDLQNIKLIRAGRSFTAIVTHQNKLKIIARANPFKNDEYELNFEVTQLVCSDEQLIGILAAE